MSGGLNHSISKKGSVADEPFRSANAYSLLGWCGFLVLAAYVLASSKPPFFDEAGYLNIAASFRRSESLREWLLYDYNGHAGPLYPLLHETWSGSGAFVTPWFRLPNLLLLMAIAWVQATVLRRWVGGTAGAGLALYLTVPMTWVIAGMALTEIPAMMGAMAALYAALWMHREDATKLGMRIGMNLLLGAGCGLALCGRQTYLVALPFLLWLAGDWRSHPLRFGLALLPGLLPAIAVFGVWRGLTSPTLQLTPGLRIEHAAMAWGYASGLALWLAPRLWLWHWRLALVAGITAITANEMTGWVTFHTLTSAQHWLPAPWMGALLERGAGFAAVGTGGGFAMVLVAEGIRHRNLVFCTQAGAVLAICVACATITHQYSSRYIAAALPFLFTLVGPWLDTGRWGLLRALIGMSVGLVNLHSYYAAF